MTVGKPFRRTARQLKDGSYAHSGNGAYVKHPDFAKDPDRYVRAFLVLQKDLLTLFDYIEPADANHKTYSFRVHELYMRTCMEIEANFRAILTENGYAAAGDWKLTDFRKVEVTHYLSQYSVRVPYWTGPSNVIEPFKNWTAPKEPFWYSEHHAAKHSRHVNFEKANLLNLISAMAGMVALLSAQFHTEDFSPQASRLIINTINDGYEEAIGGYFQVKFPKNVPAADRYDFEWEKLAKTPDPIASYGY